MIFDPRGCAGVQDDLVALLDQPVAEVRAEEARTAGDQDALAAFIETRHDPSQAGRRRVRMAGP